VVVNVDSAFLKVDFDPVVCCRPGNQTMMIIEGGYGNDSPSRLVDAHRPPTEFTQVVYDSHHLKCATLHLGKGRLSDIDPHRRFGLSPV